MPDRPNIVLILADDMGYSDIGCYGSEIRTPSLDGLAERGLRFTQMYNSARCCPSRASLLTGLSPHQAGVGHMVADLGLPAYQGYLNLSGVTIAEALRESGYTTLMSGKWHVGGGYDLHDPDSWAPGDPTHPIPTQRGFDRFYGIVAGAASYFYPLTLMRDDRFIPLSPEDFYLTDAISDNAVGMIGDASSAGNPFFLHISYTSPHWPLHALEEDIARYETAYRDGWDALRTGRHEQMKMLGIVDPAWEISPRDRDAPAWDHVRHSDWEALRMATYAAQIDRMDQGIGRVLAKLRDEGIEQNTLVMFLSDNGGCAEFMAEDSDSPRPAQYITPTPDGRAIRVGNSPEISPGPADTFTSYDLPWANASNTPFRRYKRWTHEGGISTPFIMSWPARIGRPGVVHEPVHLIDLAPTCLGRCFGEIPIGDERHADYSIGGRESADGGRKPAVGQGSAALLGARGQSRGEDGPVEACGCDWRRLGAVRHEPGQDRAPRPGRTGTGSDERAGQALRRVGRTVRRPTVERGLPLLGAKNEGTERPYIRTGGPRADTDVKRQNPA